MDAILVNFSAASMDFDFVNDKNAKEDAAPKENLDFELPNNEVDGLRPWLVEKLLEELVVNNAGDIVCFNSVFHLCKNCLLFTVRFTELVARKKRFLDMANIFVTFVQKLLVSRREFDYIKKCSDVQEVGRRQSPLSFVLCPLSSVVLDQSTNNTIKMQRYSGYELIPLD
jgi:hypothetical protein